MCTSRCGKVSIFLGRTNGDAYLHLIKAIQWNRFQIGKLTGHISGWITFHSIYGKLMKVEPWPVVKKLFARKSRFKHSDYSRTGNQYPIQESQGIVGDCLADADVETDLRRALVDHFDRDVMFAQCIDGIHHRI